MKYQLIDITIPINGRVVYTDAHWLCADSDPTKALFYGTSPQCNKNKAIVEWILKGDKFDFKMFNVGIVYVPIAYVPKRD